MRSVSIGLAIFWATTITAGAADLPQSPPPAARVLDAAYDWSGFYIGATGGYGFSGRTVTNGVVATSSDLKGGFAGGTVGFNYQVPGSVFVVGAEADAAWSDIGRSVVVGFVTAEDRINSFGSVTGRAGIAANNVLLYGKGGYAWADNQISGSALGLTLSQSQIHSGWTIGGGAEFAFAGPWSAKVEYMFARYSSATYFAAIAPPGGTLAADVNTIKAGINYRFGWGNPVVARY